MNDLSITPSGTVDDTADIQRTINEARDANKTVYLPYGTYRITDTLHITQPALGRFHTFALVGEHSGSHWGTAGVIIDARTLTDRPALSIQGARNVYIKDIQIICGNDKRPLQPKPNQIDYVKTGFSTDRHAPQSGICIDMDGITSSSSVYLNNVVIRDTVVGIMVSPKASHQADRIIINHCDIDGADIGVAYGQSQSRACHIINTNIGYTRICVDNMTYGNQQGSPPKMRGCQLGQSYQLFNTNNLFGSGFSCSDTYAEGIRCIGRHGTGPGGLRQPAIFSGCDFNISGSIYSDPPPPDVFGSWSPVLFEGSFLYFHNDNQLFTGDGPYRFNTCSFNLKPQFTWPPHEEVNCFFPP